MKHVCAKGGAEVLGRGFYFMLVVNLCIAILKQKPILPVKMDMETGIEMEISVTLCSHAAVLSR